MSILEVGVGEVGVAQSAAATAPEPLTGIQPIAGVGSSIVAPVPSGLADGDVWVIILGFEGNDGPANPPAGFTELAPETGTGDFGSDIHGVVWWKRVDTAASETDVTITVAGGYTKYAGISGRHGAADPENFLDTAPVITIGSGTTVTWPNYTTVTADAEHVLVAFAAGIVDTTTPGAYNERASVNSGDGETVWVGSRTVATAGATGAQTATLDAEAEWVAMQWAIRPGVAGTTDLTIATVELDITVGDITLVERPAQILVVPSLELDIELGSVTLDQGTTDLTIGTVELDIAVGDITLEDLADPVDTPRVEIPPPGSAAHFVPLDRWAAVVVNMFTGERLHEVRIASGDYSHVINRPGAAKVTTPLKALSDAPIDPGRHALCVMLNGEPQWSGPIWGRTTNPQTRQVTITANGWLSYLRRRIIRNELPLAGFDQLDVARRLIYFAMVTRGGNVGIVVGDTHLSGKVRNRSYPASERHTYGSVLEQLAELEDGFDFEFAPTLVAGRLVPEFRTRYPAGGIVTGHHLVHGQQISLTSVGSDATSLASHVDSIGATFDHDDDSDTPDRLNIGTASDPNVGIDYPLLEHIDSRTDVIELLLLNKYAARELARRQQPQVTFKGEITRDGPELGTYSVGDIVRVSYRDELDRIESEPVRVISRTVKIGAQATPVTVELGPADPVIGARDFAAQLADQNRRLANIER